MTIPARKRAFDNRANGITKKKVVMEGAFLGSEAAPLLLLQDLSVIL